MMPHPKLRKTIKWTGAAVTALLVVVWVGSGHWGTRWDSVGTQDAWMMRLSDGRFMIARCHWPVGHGQRHWYSWKRTDGDLQIEWLPSVGLDPVSEYIESFALFVPVWMIFLPTGALTAFVWRLDTLARRRARLNLCKRCNYDRGGLSADAACPECGQPAPPPNPHSPTSSSVTSVSPS